MKLIPEIRKAHRMLSVQLAAAGAAASAAWLTMPDDAKHQVLALCHLDQPGVLPLVGFVLVIVARFVKQSSVSGKDEADKP